LLHLEDEDCSKVNDEEIGNEAVEKSEITSADIPVDDQLLHLNDGAKLIICMVGKPARGKTYLGAKIQRYLSWLGYKAKHVETVEVRRKMFGKVEPDDFFDPNSIEMTEQRQAAQEHALKQAVEWLQDGGQVVIYDATNSTKTRRKWATDFIQTNLKDKTELDSVVSHRILWVESVCEDKDLIVQNFLQLRKKNPEFTEYKGLDEKQAVAKFLDKLKFYDREYETLDAGKEELSFLKLNDFGKSLTVQGIQGYLESKLVSFCMNIHTEPRTIILVRHGQSEYNIQDRIGGDPALTKVGAEFGKNLAKYIEEQGPNGLREVDPDNEPRKNSDDRNCYSFDPARDLLVWSSNLRRTVQTIKGVKCRAHVPWAALAEIDAGVCECMTYADFREKLPAQYVKRQRNKAMWRYPGGESYMDVKRRLEPVIFELERQRRPVLICAHRAVLRCLYSYFVGIGITTAPFLPFPLHTALVLTPGCKGWREHRVALPPNVGDLGAHEKDVQAAAKKIIKSKAKRRRLNAENQTN